jgi:hypothetical protein
VVGRDTGPRWQQQLGGCRVPRGACGGAPYRIPAPRRLQGAAQSGSRAVAGRRGRQAATGPADRAGGAPSLAVGEMQVRDCDVLSPGDDGVRTDHLLGWRETARPPVSMDGQQGGKRFAGVGRAKAQRGRGRQPCYLSAELSPNIPQFVEKVPGNAHGKAGGRRRASADRGQASRVCESGHRLLVGCGTVPWVAVRVGAVLRELLSVCQRLCPRRLPSRQ